MKKTERDPPGGGRITGAIVCGLLLVFVISTNARAQTRLLTDILDHPVVNAQGNEIGEMDDVIIRITGRVIKGLIATDGFLDIGEKEVAVSFRKIGFPDSGTIRIDMSKEQLEKHTAFSYVQPNLYTGRKYGEPIPGARGLDRTEANRREYQGGEYSRSYDPYPGAWANRRYERFPGRNYEYGHPYRWPPYPYYRYGYLPYGTNRYNWAHHPAKILGSVLLGRSVINPDGRPVATVEDLVIDIDTNKVEKFIFSTGGFIGIGEKKVAVPYKTFGVTRGGITYNISDQQLDEMQPYEP